MGHSDQDWQAFVDGQVDEALAASTNWFTVLSRTMLGLALGGVLVGVGGILVLATLLSECGDPALGSCKGVGTYVVMAIGAGLMLAGPVIALRIAGLKWWQALVGAPALGAVAWALFDLVN